MAAEHSEVSATLCPTKRTGCENRMQVDRMRTDNNDVKNLGTTLPLAPCWKVDSGHDGISGARLRAGFDYPQRPRLSLFSQSKDDAGVGATGSAVSPACRA